MFLQFLINPPLPISSLQIIQLGYSTSQGQLMRVILFATERVTANTKEAFGFIVFLLMFAIVASVYVLREGLANPNRSRYKLVSFLCIIFFLFNHVM